MPTWEQMSDAERVAFLAEAAKRRSARERKEASAESAQSSQKGDG